MILNLLVLFTSPILFIGYAFFGWELDMVGRLLLCILILEKWLNTLLEILK